MENVKRVGVNKMNWRNHGCNTGEESTCRRVWWTKGNNGIFAVLKKFFTFNNHRNALNTMQHSSFYYVILLSEHPPTEWASIGSECHYIPSRCWDDYRLLRKEEGHRSKFFYKLFLFSSVFMIVSLLTWFYTSFIPTNWYTLTDKGQKCR